MEFGAFVNFYGTREGLVHVSEISEERVEDVSDVLSEGDEVKVLFKGYDSKVRARLTMRINHESSCDSNDEAAESPRKVCKRKRNSKDIRKCRGSCSKEKKKIRFRGRKTEENFKKKKGSVEIIPGTPPPITLAKSRDDGGLPTLEIPNVSSRRRG